VFKELCTCTTNAYVSGSGRPRNHESDPETCFLFIAKNVIVFNVSRTCFVIFWEKISLGIHSVEIATDPDQQVLDSDMYLAN
jgi:hypothetical protein